jgi:hypothetical protein
MSFFFTKKKKNEKEVGNLGGLIACADGIHITQSPVKLRFRFKNRGAPFTRFFVRSMCLWKVFRAPSIG